MAKLGKEEISVKGRHLGKPPKIHFSATNWKLLIKIV